MPRIAPSEAQKRKMEITYRICDMMRRRGIRQNDLAKKIGIAAGTMSGRMHNPGTFDVDNLFAIANVLNVSPIWLIGGDTKQGGINE